MISKVIHTILAPGAYTDPISGMNLGSVYDINNPMMRGNNSFDWDMDLGKYVTHELTEEQLDVWDNAVKPRTTILDYRNADADDYTPSVEPVGPMPSNNLQGYHHVVAADVQRGDLFNHPYRPMHFFPVNTRIEGDGQNGHFVRLEYIDVYDFDQPVEWVKKAGHGNTDPNWIVVQGYDFTPSEGIASVVLYPDEWILIKDRPMSMGKITRSEGVPTGGEENRYRSTLTTF